MWSLLTAAYLISGCSDHGLYATEAKVTTEQRAFDRHGDLLNQIAPTVGDITTAGRALQQQGQRSRQHLVVASTTSRDHQPDLNLKGCLTARVVFANMASIEPTKDVDDSGRGNLYYPQRTKDDRVDSHRIDGDQHRRDEPQGKCAAANPCRTMFLRKMPNLWQVGIARDKRTRKAYEIWTIHNRDFRLGGRFVRLD